MIIRNVCHGDRDGSRDLAETDVGITSCSKNRDMSKYAVVHVEVLIDLHKLWELPTLGPVVESINSIDWGECRDFDPTI